MTVTVKLHLAVLPLVSVTVKQLVVIPFGKAEPLGKPLVCVTVWPGQLSELPTLYVTTAEH